MHIALRGLIRVLAFSFLFATSACGSMEQQPPTAWVQVPIANVSSVAGKWEGVMRRRPPERRDDDWVTVVIEPSGSYRFSSVRTIGVFSGEGEFTVDEGKLKVRSERGTIEANLYEAGDRRMLKAIGRTNDGIEYHAEVRPAK